MTDVSRFSDNRLSRILFSAVGCVCLHKGTLLLLRRQSDRTHAFCWGLPGGKVDAGESPVAAVIRETFEETGILRSPANLSHIEDFLINDDVDFKYSLFVADFNRARPSVNINSDEHTTYGWFSLEEVARLDLVPGTHECLERIGNVIPPGSEATLFDMETTSALAESVKESELRVASEISRLSKGNPAAQPVIVMGPPGAGKTTLTRNIAGAASFSLATDNFAKDTTSRQYAYLTRYLTS